MNHYYGKLYYTIVTDVSKKCDEYFKMWTIYFEAGACLVYAKLITNYLISHLKRKKRTYITFKINGPYV